MTRRTPSIVFIEADDEMAHYKASTALDDVLGWFVEDGYTVEQLRDLCEDHIGRVTEDEE